MHIEYNDEIREKKIQSAKEDIPKCQYGTLNCTLEEVTLLKLIASDPRISQKELAKKLGKSERTIKRKTVDLQEKGFVRRLNGKRNGLWEVLVELLR